MARKLAVCRFVLEECPFDRPGWAPSCVRSFCDGRPFGFGSCTTAFAGTAAACCSQANPASCLADYQKAQGYDGSKIVDACADVRYAVNSCGYSNGTFGNGYNDQAQCLCYDSTGQYAPSSWQSEASACYASGPKAHPTIYSLLAADSSAGLQLCTKYAGPSAVSATATAVGLAALVSNLATDGSSPSATSTPAVTSTQTTSSKTSSSTGAAATSGGHAQVTTNYFNVKCLVAVFGFVLPGLIATAI